MDKIYIDPIAELLLANMIIMGAPQQLIIQRRAQIDRLYREREWADQERIIMAY